MHSLPLELLIEIIFIYPPEQEHQDDVHPCHNRNRIRSGDLSNGAPLKEVSDFKFLGSWLISSTNDFKVRRAAAWDAMKILHRLWNLSVLTAKTKLQLFNTLIVSILLYNATT
jgi:hypothetical protein